MDEIWRKVEKMVRVRKAGAGEMNFEDSKEVICRTHKEGDGKGNSLEFYLNSHASLWILNKTILSSLERGNL